MPVGTPDIARAGAARHGEVVPPAVSGELLRLRVIELLARRWQAAVTTLVAGAGFGKSTALAQAVRSNLAHPEGIDAWVACEPGDEDADHLADGILSALGAPLVRHDPAAAIVHALRDRIPGSGLPGDRRRLPAPGAILVVAAARRGPGAPPAARAPGPRQPPPAAAAAGAIARERRRARHLPGQPRLHRRRDAHARRRGRATTPTHSRTSPAGPPWSASPSSRAGGRAPPIPVGRGRRPVGRRATAGHCWRSPCWARPTRAPSPSCAASRSTSIT